jgi:hypothetical protein|tara:strand:+ start:351 stop:554 length:204 start_codon:yes stop_codon:yes gene_type:complete
MRSRIKSHIIEDMMHMDVSVYLRNVLKHNKVTTLEELGAMSYTDLKIIMPKRIVIEAIGLLNKHYIF